MLEQAAVTCPYCWQVFETTVDCSAGGQSYVEDCRICCNPIFFQVCVDSNGNLLTLETSRENS